MNSSSCIQHLKKQKERSLKFHRLSLLGKTGLFLNKRLLFFHFLCSAHQSGQAAISSVLQHHSALSVHAAAQYGAIFTLKSGRSLESSRSHTNIHSQDKISVSALQGSAAKRRISSRCCAEGLLTRPFEEERYYQKDERMQQSCLLRL